MEHFERKKSLITMIKQKSLKAKWTSNDDLVMYQKIGPNFEILMYLEIRDCCLKVSTQTGKDKIEKKMFEESIFLKTFWYNARVKFRTLVEFIQELFRIRVFLQGIVLLKTEGLYIGDKQYMSSWLSSVIEHKWLIKRHSNEYKFI